VHAVFPPLYWMSCVVSNVRARVLTRRPGARFYLQQPGHPDVGITAVRVGQVFAAVRNRTNVPATFHPRHVRYLGAAMLLALRFEGLPVVEQQYARHSRYLKSSEDVKPIWQAVERNHDAGLRVRTLLDYFQPPPNLHGCVSCGALEAPKGADCLTCNFSFRMPLKPEQRIIAEQICSLMQDLQQLSGISPWDRAQEALEAFRKEQQDRKQTEDGP